MLTRHRRSVAILLLALCLLASLLYMKVWSSIDGYLGGTGHSSSAYRQEQHDLSADSLKPSPPTTTKPLSIKTQQQQEKHNLKALKEQHRLEQLERQRQKEERRQRKANRLQQQQQQDKEPFPALISTNNARVNRLNQRAFNIFCQPTKPTNVPNEDVELEHQQQQQQGGKDGNTVFNSYRGSEVVVEDSESEQRRLLTDDIDFETYDEWMRQILNKNSGQEQDGNDGNNDNDSGALNQSLKPRWPMFLERPLRGWIINHTAILEPCDRTKHTAAHCLAYLAQDHLHLVPSREARNYPNRIHNIPPMDASIQDAELGIGNGQNPESPLLRTAPSSTNSAMMHFHIFWRGVITDKLSLAAHAFLFSQPLDRARLHLWIDSTDLPEGQPEDYSRNPFAKDLVATPINQFVKLHAWNQEAQEAYAYPPLQQESVYEESGDIAGSSPQPKAQVPSVALSDEARFLILYHYGGMYLDADVLLLRDMSPLYDAGMEFAYEWSNTGMYNTAILRLNRDSSVARRILDGAKAREQEIQAAQKGEGIALDRLSWRRKKLKHSRGSGHSKSASSGTDSSSKTVSNPMKHESGRNSEHPDNDSLFAMETETPSSLPASIEPHRLVKREMRPNEIYHPARLRSYLDPVGGSLRNNGLTMLPTAVFDPLWLRVDGVESPDGLLNDKEEMMEGVETFPEVLTNPEIVCPGQRHLRGQGQDFSAGPEVFFTGAYAYHWHNNWLTPIEPKSWMGLMRKAFDEFLTGERPNLYGEYFQ